MNAKVILVAGLLAATGWTSNAALAQDDAGSPMDRMTHMQGLMEEFDRAETPEERYELMQEHMALMRAEMADMQGTMTAQLADGEMPDMTAMHQHMGMMQGMMMQMMGQQGMMMRMPGMMSDDQVKDGPEDSSGDGEEHQEHHEEQ